MELIQNLGLGLATAAQPANLLFCFFGALLGTADRRAARHRSARHDRDAAADHLQGSPESSLIMLAGIYYGAQYGGSTTAILINLPGEASSAVTAIDGYQMARNGRAGVALAIAALGSFSPAPSRRG